MSAGFVKKAIHGGRIVELRKITGRDFLDVSASMNPFVPEVLCAVKDADFSYYPDDTYAELKDAISRVFHRNPAEICVGNGSIEIIRAYCRVMLDENKTYYSPAPTFSEYQVSAELTGAKCAGVDEVDVRFLCNPNNPTGELLSKRAVLDLCSASSNLFVDEAFMELAARDESVINSPRDNLFVSRSLTKCFSVPGMRFGFGFGPEDLVEKIETARCPWSVNAAAESFALSAMTVYDKLKESAAKITLEREWYFAELKRLRLTYSPSEVNFITIYLPVLAAEFSEKMMEKGILVRDCTSFGLRNAIRVSIESHEKNKHVIEAMEECLH